MCVKFEMNMGTEGVEYANIWNRSGNGVLIMVMVFKSLYGLMYISKSPPEKELV